MAKAKKTNKKSTSKKKASQKKTTAAGNQIAVYALFTKAWQLTQKHAGLLFMWGVTLLSSQVVLFYLAELFGPGTAGYMGTHGVAVLVHAFFQVSLTRAILKLIRGKKVEYQDAFWVDPEAFLWYLVASVFYVVAMMAGLIAFVVPGIMLGLLYSQYLFVIVDEKATAVQALEKSVKLTKNQLPALFEFVGLGLLMMIFGALLAGVGLIVAVPVVTLGAFLLYEELRALK